MIRPLIQARFALSRFRFVLSGYSSEQGDEFDIAGNTRLAQEESLHFGATFRAKDVQLLCGFDALSRGLHSHALSDANYSPHDI